MAKREVAFFKRKPRVKDVANLFEHYGVTADDLRAYYAKQKPVNEPEAIKEPEAETQYQGA